ncbi:hypothetical protein SDC9_174524 [bioreactor metagenome]|uniref:Uncharacterized protein n=1 Tax=bioreactor metagenome TaxID=1076179 RepID=A0A645GJL8_9ZZZZ
MQATFLAHAGYLAEALFQFRVGRIALLVRQKSCMERDELDAQLPGNICPSLNVAPVRFPRGIRGYPAGRPDGFQGGIVLTRAAKHSADNPHACLSKPGGGAAPNGRVFTQWIEGELHPVYADG